jgi:uncharacterized membrane protein YdjX (TVP38/TMEM64 family)
MDTRHRLFPGLRWAETTRLPIYRLSLLALLIVGFPTLFLVAFDSHLGLDVLRRHQIEVLGFVAGQPVLAPLLFMVVYAVAVAVSLPGAALLTMVAGYLFGWLEGSLYVLVAAVLASLGVFLLARSALAETVRVRAGPSIQRFAQGFRTRALAYVFVLFLVPVFPYGMIIALPAAFGVKIATFLLGTLLGLLPGTLLLAHLGEGLGAILTGTQPFQLASFATPQIVLPALGLGVLCLLPLAWRLGLWRGRAQGRIDV